MVLVISKRRARNPLKRRDGTDIATEPAVRTTVDTIGAASRGDAASFMMLYYAKARGIAAYIAPTVANEQQRDRLLRQIFRTAWSELPSLKRAEEFDLWLLRLAHRELGLDRDDAPLSLETGEAAVNELLTLPARFREVLALRYFCGLTPEQIAVEYDVATPEVDEWHRLGLEALARTTETRRRFSVAA